MMNNNMWQKCPVCNGQGIVPDMISLGSKQCHVCNGHGIISMISGMPPIHDKYNTTTSTTTNSGVNELINNK
jgi:DnaJ-class molecular chaperone